MKSSTKSASKSSKSKSSTRNAVSFETMEARQMLSGTVTVTGTNNADTIVITQSGANFTVVTNGQTKTYANQPISSIQVDCLGGNDRVTVATSITLPVTINGGDGNDTIYSGNGNDVINGGIGNDFMNANGGNDTVYGVDGNDTVYGGEGADMIYGGHGDDILDGEGGTDYVNGNGQADLITTVTPVKAVLSARTVNTRAVTLAAVKTTASFVFYSDNDIVRGGAGNDVVDGAGGDDVVYGGLGDDECWGGDGNDRVYGGGGNNRLIGGNGDDVLVSVGGGTSDLLWGQAGNDSFWMDDARNTELPMDGEAAEFAGSNFHFISTFQTLKVVNGGTVTSDHRAESKELNGGNFIDPISTNAYTNFAGKPLFAPDGAKADDIDQGGIGDCYFLAGLSAIAKKNPFTIKQAVVDLGDGTYGVRFFQNGLVKYYRVDGDLPASGSTLVNAGLGHGNSIWVPIMEKAFAYFRSNVGTYASIESGFLYEPFNALALTNNSFFGNSSTQLLQNIKSYLDQGKAVTVSTPHSTPAAGTRLVDGHVYSVDRVDLNAGTITVRNPWGWDGVGTDSNTYDGYVTLTASQFFGFCSGARWSNVA